MDVDPPSPPHTRIAAAIAGGMILPQGVVANAPYVGHAPAAPSIVVPLAGSSVLRGWGQPQSRVEVLTTGPDAAAHAFRAVQKQREQAQEVRRKQMAARGDDDSAMGALTAALTYRNVSGSMSMRPSMLNAAIMGLSAEQLHQVTGSRPQTAQHNTHSWTYEKRRVAQPVLDFMYLGPSSVARDRDFLRRAGITMLLATRDSRMAEARLLSVGRTACELGIAVHYVDVFEDRRGELIRALPGVVRTINEHMMQQFQQAGSDNGAGAGRVLVFCETGNERSAAVVAAYILTVYGVSLIEALQFVNACRFCTSFDEDTKGMLLNYCEILQAQRDVGCSNDGGAADADIDCSSQPPAETRSFPSRDRSLVPIPSRNAVPPRSSASRSRSWPKRRIEETLDDEDDRREAEGDYALSREPSAETPRLHLDMARYLERKTFVPFSDVAGLQVPPS
ncbi:putative dual specificity protein phosphatase 3 [Grosmannia clavigera kw1407]|uniref:Putative dual specificity protein phosphatase 3 n=1 Tax=Grosmannia clavigera (strain kw1407 / UAMH 11150) TaxID=655863 RepID=F0XGV5_GROCL|nr:putative dual specificity protein phosphatase 3 [Grosmannia clavigera kw1407]EFX03084.1 putative dual specificity protein phosphatase 3 [Grosmannia clavigera kw1407]